MQSKGKTEFVYFVFLNGKKLLIENEYHAFSICPKYVNIRERYF